MMSLVENGCGLMMMRRGNIESSRVRLDLSSMSSRGFRPVVGGTFLRSIGTGALSTAENQFRRYFILSNTQSKPRGYQVPYPFGRREFYILLRYYDDTTIRSEPQISPLTRAIHRMSLYRMDQESERKKGCRLTSRVHP